MDLPRLLITGSSGRIGSILAEGLSDLFEIFGVDLIASPRKRTFITDISNHEQLSNVLREIVPLPYIVHLAADPRVGAEWDSVLRNNIIGTKNLYEVAKEYKVKKIVYASSNHATGAYEGIFPTLHKHSRFLVKLLQGSTMNFMGYTQSVSESVLFWLMTNPARMKESKRHG